MKTYKMFGLVLKIEQDLDNPNFKELDRIHNWRNHIDYDIKNVWKKLTKREKFLIAYLAEKEADQEEWD